MAKLDLMKIARFPLPQDWQPIGTACVLITIPDDQEYFSTLIGLIDTLKWSKSFDRDNTLTGAAIVARTWQAALESEPIRFGNCEELMTVNVTVNCNCGCCDCGTSGEGGVIIPDEQLPGVTACTLISGWHIWLCQQFEDGLVLGVSPDNIVNTIMGKIALYGPTALTRNNLLLALDRYEAYGRPVEYIEECAYLTLFTNLSAYIAAHTTEVLTNLSAWWSGDGGTGESTLTQALNLAASSLSQPKLYQWCLTVPNDCLDGFGEGCHDQNTEVITFDSGGYEGFSFVHGVDTPGVGNPGDAIEGVAWFDPVYDGWKSIASILVPCQADGSILHVDIDMWRHYHIGGSYLVAYDLVQRRDGVIIHTTHNTRLLGQDTWVSGVELFDGILPVMALDTIEINLWNGFGNYGNSQQRASDTDQRMDNISITATAGVL